MPENAAEHGVFIDQMLEFCHWFMLVLFIGWSAFFLYTLWRFRRKRNPKADYHGVRSHTSSHLEVSVVLIEAILLLGFALPLWAQRVNDFPTQDALMVRVIAEQFGYQFHYAGKDGEFGETAAHLVSGGNPIGLNREDPDAKDDIVVRGTVTVPVGRPVIMMITSKDVIHNVTLHDMRIAQDAIPGMEVPMWFTPIKEGMYELVCGQLCGVGHTNMRAFLEVVSPEEFEQWMENNTPAEAAAVANAETLPDAEEA